MANRNRLYDAAFVLLLPVAVLFAVAWYRGFLLGDNYLGAAHELLHGHWDIENNFWANRVGTYLPYVIGIYLFGFGPWLNFIATFQFLVLLVVVYWVVGRYSRTLAFISACLLTVSVVMQQSACVVMGDVAATLTANAVVLCYFYFLFYVTPDKVTAKKWGVLCATLVTISFLVKESVVFYLPLLLWFFYTDRKVAERRIFWKYFTVTSTIAALILMLVYRIKTGDVFYRLHAVEVLPSASASNYSTAGWGAILNRITWQPFEFLVEQYSFGALLLLSVLQLITPPGKDNRGEVFFKVYLLATLGMWWLGSQGLSSYNPVALVHRLWLPLLVPLAINSALFILKTAQGDIKDRTANIVSSVTVVFFMLAAVSLYVSHMQYATLGLQEHFVSVGRWYLALSIAVLVGVNAGRVVKAIAYPRLLPFVFVILPLGWESCNQLHYFVYNEHHNIKRPDELEQEILLSTLALKPHLVIGDPQLAYFYYAYIMDMDKKQPIADYNTLNTDSIRTGDYLLLNKERQLFVSKSLAVTFIYTRDHNRVPLYITEPAQHGFTLVKENATDVLYRFDGGSVR